MPLAYTAPIWTDGSGEGISASNLQAISNNLEGLVQGADKAVHSVSINGSVITLTFADGTEETATAVNLKGVTSITKTGTAGNVDTYTITYSDGTTSTFNVTNGEDGETGPQGPQGPTGSDGVSPVITISQITGGTRVTITDAAHPDGQSFDVMNGTGTGDMTQAVYDPNGTVETAGGIVAYVDDMITDALTASY